MYKHNTGYNTGDSAVGIVPWVRCYMYSAVGIVLYVQCCRYSAICTVPYHTTR